MTTTMEEPYELEEGNNTIVPSCQCGGCGPTHFRTSEVLAMMWTASSKFEKARIDNNSSPPITIKMSPIVNPRKLEQ